MLIYTWMLGNYSLVQDCIDGKQARRTRSSSPLGQLFDHGCDALCVFMLMGITQARQIDSSGLTIKPDHDDDV